MNSFFDYTVFGIFLKWIFFIMVGIFVFIVLPINIWGYRDIDSIKDGAPAFIENSGFENVVYADYGGDIVDGGGVEYIANRPELPNLIYCVGVQEWRGELMIYKLSVINDNYVVGEGVPMDDVNDTK